MNKPNTYDNTQAAGDYKKLAPGGYICKIMKAEEAQTRNGNAMLKGAIDIAEGEYKEFFKETYDGDSRADKKWPNSGMFYIVPEFGNGDTNPTFKAFCTAVEESNSFKLDWGKDFGPQLKGKQIGVIFREEEYENQDSMLRTSVKPYGYRSVETIKSGKFNVPEIKRLKPEDRTSTRPQTLSDGSQLPDGFEMVTDDDIPF